MRTAMNPGGSNGDNVGTVQDDAFQGHTHGFVGAASTAGGSYFSSTNSSSNGTNYSNGGYGIDGSYGTPRIAAETRPTNASVNFIIKY